CKTTVFGGRGGFDQESALKPMHQLATVGHGEKLLESCE
ncbi:MAG: hypothetical protein RL298_142, partial [Pseudomonadota bacterium]